MIVVLPQASVAEAEPSAPLISAADGLQPSVTVVLPGVNTGAVISPGVHVTLLEIVAVLPQASLAVNVLVLEMLQPLVTTLPSEEVMVTAPQASVAVAVPREASGLTGLQPRFTSP